MIENNNANELCNKLQEIRDVIDEAETPNLSNIKEILKKMHFADIVNEDQVQENQGDIHYQIPTKDEVEDLSNKNLSYTILTKRTGLVYAHIYQSRDKDGIKQTNIKYLPLSNYARFLADIVANKVIYSNELKMFLKVKNNCYDPIDEITFLKLYPVDNKQQISDFYEVLSEVFEKHIQEPLHDFIIYPYHFAGKDWVYDCKKLEMDVRIPSKGELFFAYYNVEGASIDYRVPRDFMALIAGSEASLHNLRLTHAYVMYRKLNLAPAERWFLMKDFGRTGKGLIVETFKGIFKYNQINFDNLKSKSFEQSNEWANFYGAEVAHANETGSITVDDMRILRKIATSEIVTARHIGKNIFKFKNEAVLILDTNETVDIGKITANVSRTVKIAFKDRPRGETSDQRHAAFKRYWDYIQPNGVNSIEASLSFLLFSLEYLKEMEMKFNFKDVTLKNYASADDLTETQQLLIEIIACQGFILSNEEVLQKAISNDYGNLRFQKAKDDIKAIGVIMNKSKWIDGQNYKVNTIGDEELFKESLRLIEEDNSNPLRVRT